MTEETRRLFAALQATLTELSPRFERRADRRLHRGLPGERCLEGTVAARGFQGDRTEIHVAGSNRS